MNQVDLSWVNPGDSDFAGVMIRRSLTSFPATASDGVELYDGTGTFFPDDTVTQEITYYYSAFAYDQHANHSSGATASGQPVISKAVGWIGGGLDGWQTGNAPAAGLDYRSFREPWAVCVDSSGNVYVADGVGHRICKWDASGNAIGWIGGGQNGWQTGIAPLLVGSDYQSFNFPYGVFVDSSGYIFVSDCGNYRISKWDSIGNAIGWIGGGQNGWQTGNNPGSGGLD